MAKLTDMLSTREKVESQLKSAEARAEKAGDKPAGATTVAAVGLGAAAAAAVLTPKAEKAPESILDAINSVLGQPLENMLDSVKAVAEVMSEKLEDAVEEMAEKAVKIMDVINEPATQTEDVAVTENHVTTTQNVVANVTEITEVKAIVAPVTAEAVIVTEVTEKTTDSPIAHAAEVVAETSVEVTDSPISDAAAADEVVNG